MQWIYVNFKDGNIIYNIKLRYFRYNYSPRDFLYNTVLIFLDTLMEHDLIYAQEIIIMKNGLRLKISMQGVLARLS